MKNNPILIFTGLAAVAVVAVAGVTKDRWIPATPEANIAETATATKKPAAEKQAVIQAPDATQAADSAEQTAALEQPKAEQPKEPVADQPSATVSKEAATVTEEPSATVSKETAAVAEQPSATVSKETAAVADQPSATTSKETAAVAEQPSATISKETAAVTEEPSATVSKETAAIAEQPSATVSKETAAEIEASLPQQSTSAETKAVEPSFDTVRVEKTGEALIAGRAEPGSEVTVMLDGKAIGKTTANNDGAFVVTPEEPLPTGSGALTVESKTNEQITQSEATVAVVVPAEEKKDALVAVLNPDEPTKILQKTEPAAKASATIETATPPATTEIAAATPPSLDAVDYDESGNIVFSGSGRPGSIVRLYVDNAVAGDAKAGEDGRWSFAGSSPIPAGKHTLRVDGVDTAGKVTSRAELPFFREEPSKVASAAPKQTAATTTITQTPAAKSATDEIAATETPVIESSKPETSATETTQTGTTIAKIPAVGSATSETTTTPTPQAETTTNETPAVESATSESTATGTTQADTTTTETPAPDTAATEIPAETATRDATSTGTTAEQTVASATTETNEIAKPKDGRIIIQPGNNLWRISRVIYGSGTKYTVIFESNKDQIRDADLIFPGQVFMTPNVVPPENIDPKRRDSLKPEEGGGAG